MLEDREPSRLGTKLCRIRDLPVWIWSLTMVRILRMRTISCSVLKITKYWRAIKNSYFSPDESAPKTCEEHVGMRLWGAGDAPFWGYEQTGVTDSQVYTIFFLFWKKKPKVFHRLFLKLASFFPAFQKFSGVLLHLHRRWKVRGHTVLPANGDVLALLQPPQQDAWRWHRKQHSWKSPNWPLISTLCQQPRNLYRTSAPPRRGWPSFQTCDRSIRDDSERVLLFCVQFDDSFRNWLQNSI